LLAQYVGAEGRWEYSAWAVSKMHCVAMVSPASVSKLVVWAQMQVDMSFWSFLCFDMLQLMYLQACCVWMVAEGSVLHGLGEVQVLRQSTRICRGNDRRIYERELFSFRDWVMQYVLNFRLDHFVLIFCGTHLLSIHKFPDCIGEYDVSAIVPETM
jgi:hypothetical protein